jgi:hypothetical protein
VSNLGTFTSGTLLLSGHCYSPVSARLAQLSHLQRESRTATDLAIQDQLSIFRRTFVAPSFPFKSGINSSVCCCRILRTSNLMSSIKTTTTRVPRLSLTPVSVLETKWFYRSRLQVMVRSAKVDSATPNPRSRGLLPHLSPLSQLFETASKPGNQSLHLPGRQRISWPLNRLAYDLFIDATRGCICPVHNLHRTWLPV